MYNNTLSFQKYFLALLFILIATFNPLSGQEIEWDVIDFSNSTSVEGKINGLNMGGYAYGLINMQSSNITVTDECTQCLNFNPQITGKGFTSMETKPAVVVETAKLKPSVLRFPGGTHSAWYHFYKLDNDGFYNAAAPEIDKGYGMSLIETIFLPNPKTYCQNDSRLMVEQNYIDGFINFITNLQNTAENTTKIEVTYVANLLTHFNFDPVVLSCERSAAIIPMDDFDCSQAFEYSYEGNEALFDNNPAVYRFELYYKETQDALSYLVENLDLSAEDVMYVEMGNEYYFNDGPGTAYAFSKFGMGANEYADLVEIYAERLKCFFNGKVTIKIGVVSKPGSTWQEADDTSNDNYPGLVNLLNQDVTNDGATLLEGIDAVILHDYYSKSNCLTENDIEARFNCAKGTFRDFIEGADGLKGDLDDLKEKFQGKEIWTTEWNILAGTDKKNEGYLNTVLHASFVLEYALSLLEYNAENGNIVTMSTHHRIGFDRPWSVIQTKDGDNETAIVRAGAYVMKYLNKLYDYDNFSFIGNVLKDDSAIFDTKEAKTMTFYQEADDEMPNDRLLLYYTNKTKENIPFTIPTTIGGKDVISAKVSYLQGNHLFSYGASNGTHGKNTFKNGSSHQDAALNTLGYGDLHDQLNNEFEILMDLTTEQFLGSNSIGVVEVLFDETTSIEPLESSKLSINVYPNPTIDVFNWEVSVKESTDLQVEIRNVLGDKIQQEYFSLSVGKNQQLINLSALPNGVYFINFNINNTVTSKRVIKI